MAAENWQDNSDLKKLYISKLKPETSHERLVEYIGKYGEVTDCKIVKDNQGTPRGFAFLSMSDQADVDKVLDNKPHTIDGQVVFMRRAIPKDDPNPLAQAITKKLFVGGLTEEATEQDITDVLGIFTSQQPQQIKLMRDRTTNKFKGYAFVIFESEDVVDKLFIIRNATIKAKRVELKKAEELGAPGAGGRGGARGGARGRGGGRGGGGEFRGRGARGGSYSANQGGYPQSYDYSCAYGGGEYEGFSGGSGYDYNGYGSYSSGGGGSYGGGSYGGGSYGGGSYGSGGYGGGYDNMGSYRSEASGYGPNRRGRGRGAGGGGGGGGYHPY